MVKWNRWDSTLCPLCHTSPETTKHVLVCQCDCCSNFWTQQLQHLQQWLSQSDTSLAIQHDILSTLEHCSHPSFQELSPLCHQTAFDQDQIVFFGFMVGCLTPSWQRTQDAHYVSSRSTWLAKLWLVHLCCQV